LSEGKYPLIAGYEAEGGFIIEKNSIRGLANEEPVYCIFGEEARYPQSHVGAKSTRFSDTIFLLMNIKTAKKKIAHR